MMISARLIFVARAQQSSISQRNNEQREHEGKRGVIEESSSCATIINKPAQECTVHVENTERLPTYS